MIIQLKNVHSFWNAFSDATTAIDHNQRGDTSASSAASTSNHDSNATAMTTMRSGQNADGKWTFKYIATCAVVILLGIAVGYALNSQFDRLSTSNARSKSSNIKNHDVKKSHHQKVNSKTPSRIVVEPEVDNTHVPKKRPQTPGAAPVSSISKGTVPSSSIVLLLLLLPLVREQDQLATVTATHCLQRKCLAGFSTKVSHLPVVILFLFFYRCLIALS
jgi:hypothetical protein